MPPPPSRWTLRTKLLASVLVLFVVVMLATSALTVLETRRYLEAQPWRTSTPPSCGSAKVGDRRARPPGQRQRRRERPRQRQGRTRGSGRGAGRRRRPGARPCVDGCRGLGHPRPRAQRRRQRRGQGRHPGPRSGCRAARGPTHPLAGACRCGGRHRDVPGDVPGAGWRYASHRRRLHRAGRRAALPTRCRGRRRDAGRARARRCRGHPPHPTQSGAAGPGGSHRPSGLGAEAGLWSGGSRGASRTGGRR